MDALKTIYFETDDKSFQIQEYGLLIYDTLNLGDEIQSLAAKQYLPHTDILLNRDTLELSNSPLTNNVKIIYNGWFDGNYCSFPPPKNVNPLFISFHINEVDHSNDSLYDYLTPKNKTILTEDNIKYLKKYEPIGCRDYHTVKKLQENNISAYFSGCLTLTLQNKFSTRNDEIIVVDSHILCPKLFKSIIPEDIRKKAVYIEQGLHIKDKITNNDEKFEKAQQLLDRLAQAKFVITSRLHTALPCLAFGTPVIFLTEDKNDVRFTGYDEFVHFFSYNDIIELDFFNFENKNQEKLQDVIKNLRGKAKVWVNEPLLNNGISIFSVCMNRNLHLSQSLPTWIKAKPNEIIIIDWNSSEKLDCIIKENQKLADDNNVCIIYARVTNVNSWVLSKSFNLAARLSKYNKILKLDCDNLLSPDFLLYHNLEGDNFFAGDWQKSRNRNEYHLNGVIYLRKEDFININGYNEYITTYGYDDCDLYSRLQKKGLKRNLLNLDKIAHINHPNNSRFENQKIIRLDIEIEKNRLMCEKIMWSSSFNLSKFSSSFKYDDKNIEMKFISSVELSDDLNENFKEKAIKNRSYVQSNEKLKLYIYVQNGLGNRLRSFASAYSIAKKTNRELILIWIPNEHCEAKFYDLYENNYITKNMKIIENISEYNYVRLEIDNSTNFDLYNYIVTPNVYVDDLSKRHIFISSGCIINNKNSDWYSDCNVLRSLKVKEELEEQIYNFGIENNIENTIGVQIRMGQNTKFYSYENTDNYRDVAKSSIEKWRNCSHYETFIKEMKKILLENPKQKFFICCDNLETYGVIVSKMPENSIIYFEKDVEDRSLKQIQSAVIDIYLLSKTKFLLGSNWSSFTELFSRLSGKQTKLAGVHF